VRFIEICSSVQHVPATSFTTRDNLHSRNDNMAGECTVNARITRSANMIPQTFKRSRVSVDEMADHICPTVAHNCVPTRAIRQILLRNFRHGPAESRFSLRAQSFRTRDRGLDLTSLQKDDSMLTFEQTPTQGSGAIIEKLVVWFLVKFDRGRPGH
jgi:hypothetical protein